MKISKEASVLSGGTPSEQQLAQINQYTKSPLTAQQVYCFSVRLCDDLPDRDFERFDTAALPVLAQLFCGKTGIVDHEWSADRQIARIFATEVCRQPDCSFLLAHCYMLRSEKNADLIAEIEGGIKKEVSLGCAVGQVSCSVCGSVYGSCEHRKGVTYDGKTCLAVLSQPTDAYEFSFVAVPAQRQAGVMKAKKGGVPVSLSQFVEKSGSPELQAALRHLEKEAGFGRQYREAAVQKAVSLTLLLDLGCSEEILHKAFSGLEPEDLNDLCSALEKKAGLLFPPTAQLPTPKCCIPQMDADYMI